MVADHHSGRRADGAWDLAELVKVSCALASALDFAAFSSCEIASCDDLLDELPLRERRVFHPYAETLGNGVPESIRAIESV